MKNAAYTLLNAGRGNPNWLAIECRKAFFALGMFAVEEAERDFYLPEGIAGVPQKEGISVRFEDWMRAHAGEPGVDFLKGAYEYALTELSADADSIIDEWAGGIMGHNYPTPPRILRRLCVDDADNVAINPLDSAKRPRVGLRLFWRCLDSYQLGDILEKCLPHGYVRMAADFQQTLPLPNSSCHSVVYCSCGHRILYNHRFYRLFRAAYD